MVCRLLRPRLLLIAFCLLASTGVTADPKQEAARSALIERYNRQAKPKNRIPIAVRLTNTDLQELRSAYKEEAARERASQALQNYLSGLDLLQKTMQEAGTKGSSKNAEISLRKQLRDLEQLKLSLSVLEREFLQPALDRAAKAHEEALHLMMK